MGNNMHKEATERLREQSGRVECTGRLVSFLYTLMRDELPPGKVEFLVQVTESEGDCKNIYTNGWLAKYAESLAARLTCE